MFASETGMKWISAAQTGKTLLITYSKKKNELDYGCALWIRSAGWSNSAVCMWNFLNPSNAKAAAPRSRIILSTSVLFSFMANPLALPFWVDTHGREFQRFENIKEARHNMFVTCGIKVSLYQYLQYTKRTGKFIFFKWNFCLGTTHSFIHLTGECA